VLQCSIWAYGVGVCKNIRRGWDSRFVRFEVGDGSRIKFWHDVGGGDQTLKEAFSVLFSIALHKEALVVNLVQFSNNSFLWNVPGIILVHGWEVELFT